MTTYAIRNEYERELAIKAIGHRKLPCSVQISTGAPRSIEQNRLQRLWVKELEEQGDMTAEEYRGWRKLHIGMMILLHEDDVFRAEYDRLVKPLSYENKMMLMMLPFDFPITRKMTTKQKAKYLDRIYEHFTGKGFVLTRPEPK